MFISIDLGGTKTRVASTEDLKSILKSDIFATEQVLELEQEQLLEAIDEVSDSGAIEGVVIGVPGIVNSKERRLETIVNVKELTDLPFQEILKNKFSDEIVFVQNDAALAGLGEAVFGSGKEFNVVGYLTLSTGVGGVRIENKRIQTALEPGHMILDKNEDRNFKMCGQKGCFSYYCSGTGFEQNYGESPVTCTNQEYWNDYAKNLSLGLINTIAMWSPDVIVLGGSMTKAYEKFFKEPLEKELAQHEFFEIPPIRLAKLEDSAGLVGGFAYLSYNL